MINKKTITQGLRKQAEDILKIPYANVNGIGDKTISLESAVQLAQADIIAIVETKQIPQNQMDTENGYQMERTNRKGRGVALTIREEMTEITNRVTEFDEETEEIIWIEVSITN